MDAAVDIGQEEYRKSFQGGSKPKVANWRFPVAVPDIKGNSNYKRKFPQEVKILVTNFAECFKTSGKNSKKKGQNISA